MNQNLEKIDHKIIKQLSQFKEYTRDERKYKAVGRSKRKYITVLMITSLELLKRNMLFSQVKNYRIKF